MAARKNKRMLTLLRRGSQLFCFSLFIFLFIKTDYNGADQIDYAVNLLFRIDPLLAFCAWLAAGTFIVLMLPALITLALTLLLGRFFCGWACPMGTLLDGTHHLIPPRVNQPTADLKKTKYYLLFFLLAGAWGGLPIAGYFDPFSILVRGLALVLYPAVNALSTAFFTFTYAKAPEWVNLFTEPVYTFLKETVLPFSQKHYDLALLSLAILLTVFLLERLERRFFCRNLCPLGGMLAITARFARLKGRTGAQCGKCRNCRDICRMGAIDEERNISPADCNLCLDCVTACPGNKISFGFGGMAPAKRPFSLSRRLLVGSVASGLLLPFFMKSRSMAKRPDPFLIRPPGALPEDDFIGHCVRCGECMKVCIGNALQPAFLEAGIEGLFTPKLSARLGYCEYNCSLCGQVCPTGAIQNLNLAKKQSCKIGHAWFDKNRCLPFAKGIPCMVCEEHCPTPDKAIKFREALVVNDTGDSLMVKQPYIVDKFCIGCGICETKCPLPGASAVRVTSGGETRNPKNRLPSTWIDSGY